MFSRSKRMRGRLGGTGRCEAGMLGNWGERQGEGQERREEGEKLVEVSFARLATKKLGGRCWERAGGRHRLTGEHRRS